jgi:type IV pilus assembly protein PilM
MKFSNSSGSVGHAEGRFESWFPTPRTLTPLSCGIDISDSSIKWLGLSPNSDGSSRVVTYGSRDLQKGIVTGGVIRDIVPLQEALRELKKEHPMLERAHAALPEEVAYVFSMQVPEKSTREQILQLIEFELEGRVPIPASSAIFDFDIIAGGHDAGNMEVGVVVFPREIVENYAAAFEGAGIELLSLEIEARSVARAVSGGSDSEPTTLLVDFGYERTGFALLKDGVPIFTSTVEIGGESITRIVTEKLTRDPEAVWKFKNEEGLLSTRKEAIPVVEAITSAATALAEEISRHFHYWDSRRDTHGERVTPVGQVLLVGGGSNLRGLADFISGKVHASTQKANVWRNICSFNEYIPPVESRSALQYATAVGLALRSIHHIHE